VGNIENLVNYKDGFDTSNHSFLNTISNGLIGKIADISPELELVPSGKSVSGPKINLTLSGQIIVNNTDELHDIDTKVRQFMDSIRNPANFIPLIDS
jgi:hypothetical protein